MLKNSQWMSVVLLCAISIGTALADPATEASPDNSPAKPAAARPRTLGVLLFNGFEMLDACGPMEMWGNVTPGVKVVTVAKEKAEVASAQSPKLMPDYSFADCPPLDLILVPGGKGVLPILKDAPTMDWLREKSAKAEITMSVCNGASLLASAGLLDGRRATTNKAYWKMATTPGPKVNWVARARWVDDGNIVSSSGVSAGMDMSLHVIARLFGEQTAEAIAQGTEYEWHRDPAWDPFAEIHGLAKAE